MGKPDANAGGSSSRASGSKGLAVEVVSLRSKLSALETDVRTPCVWGVCREGVEQNACKQAKRLDWQEKIKGGVDCTVRGRVSGARGGRVVNTFRIVVVTLFHLLCNGTTAGSGKGANPEGG